MKSLLGLFGRVGALSLIVGIGAFAAATTSGCSDDTGTGGGSAVDCTTVKPYSQLNQAFSKCTTCHSSELTTATDRQSAPEGFDYDTYELAIQHPEEIAEQIEDGLMPPDGSPALTTTEANDLITWARCDTPE